MNGTSRLAKRGTKRQLYALILLGTLLATGCSSIGNLREEKPRPFGGVAGWYETAKPMMQECISQDVPSACFLVPLIGTPLMIDLTLSTAMDTLTLPWVLYRMVQPGPALWTWSWSLPKC
jgi:uncharacterized protein YceK